MRRRLAAVAIALAAGACAPRTAPAPPQPTASLAATLDSIADTAPLHRTHWGVLVVDAASGDTLYARSPDRLFITASNMKLVTAAVALGRLGPDYRYRTPLLARRSATGTTLILRGSGDPTWSNRFHSNAAAPLDSLAAAVARAGIRAVDTLYVDASLFTDAAVHSAWEVGDLPWSYAPPTAAVALAEGTFRLIMTGGADAGAPATFRVEGVPQPVVGDVVTDTAGASATLRIDYTARRDTVRIRGRVGAGAVDTSTIAVTRPAHSAAETFRDALARAGVSAATLVVIEDSARAAGGAQGADTLAIHMSPPMSAIAAAILQPSQNWIAEQVLKTLGAELRDDGSWNAGVAVAREFMYDVAGVDSGAINLRDASGLSAQNLLTPGAVVTLLDHALEQPWGTAFREGLAAPGLTGSTLSGRLRDLDGRVQAKTGTISNVNSLGGYITTVSGRTLLFSILSNGSGQPSSRVRGAIDAMVLAIARHADSGGAR